MRNKKGSKLIGLGLLLIVAAFSLVIYNYYEDYRAKVESENILEKLPSKMRDGLTVPDYMLNPEMEMPIVKIDGQGYIGILVIPDLGLELPVNSEWSYPNLDISPCRYSGSAYLDNLVIAAHNFSHHFGSLDRLEIGQKVIFTDCDGNIFNYEVVVVETLMPNEVKEMTSGDYDLSLFTCTLSGSYRVTVRCDSVE